MNSLPLPNLEETTTGSHGPTRGECGQAAGVPLGSLTRVKTACDGIVPSTVLGKETVMVLHRNHSSKSWGLV